MKTEFESFVDFKEAVISNDLLGLYSDYTAFYLY